ncbi:MAG: LCP family protein [Actinobacteria bacterium]|nr:LCP family protein [Actinomycetota bacterium]
MGDKRPPTARIILIIAAVIVAIVLLGIGGTYAWLATTLSQAGNRPGVEEAREALREPVSSRAVLPDLDQSVTATGASPDGTGPANTPNTVNIPVPEKPRTMNILLLGADKRDNDSETYGRSDTMMVAHIDSQAGFVSILSLPRDLRVRLDGYGFQKLNAAYALGGDALAIRTIRDLTGVKIDHYAKIDLQTFQVLVDHFGGIYVDVDRRYYDDGEVLLAIDLQPGYQLLNGDAALRYVRTRHDWDHDWARIQRQQRFLRAAKEQVLKWNAALRLPGAVNALTEHLTTDMGPNDILRLAWWGAHLNMDRVKQVSLIGADRMIDDVAYVVSTEAQLRAAVDDLLTAPLDPGATTTSTSTTELPPRDMTLDLSDITVEFKDAGAGPDSLTAAARFLSGHGARVVNSGPTATVRAESALVYPAQMERTLAHKAGLIGLALGVPRMLEDNALHRVVLLAGVDFVPPDPVATLADLETARWRLLSTQSGFSLAPPGWLPPGYSFAGSRVYYIASDGGDKMTVHVTYKLRNQEQYMGITVSCFGEAPAAAPGRRVVREGVVFTVVGPDAQPERVWWKKDGLLWWVSNTLASVLSTDELLGVAQSCICKL